MNQSIRSVSPAENAPNTEKPNEIVLNKRYGTICIALGIKSKDDGTEAFYRGLLNKRMCTLIDSEFVRRAGSVSVSRPRNSGPSHALKKEFIPGNCKNGTIDYELACATVYRLIGFIWCHDEQRWVMLPERWLDRKADQQAAEKSRKRSDWQRHRLAYSVVPEPVRQRIFRLWEAEPDTLYRYAAKAIEYLEGPEAGPLPEAPWNRTQHFKNGHRFIVEFLNAVGNDSTPETVITVASINNYITASIGFEQVMSALLKGARVRFLIYDFLNGDSEGVAKMIGRSQAAFYSNASDSVEALCALQEAATDAKFHERLEIRLLADDPVGRWYVIDTPVSPLAFVVRRDPDVGSKAAAVPGGRVEKKAALEEAKVVNELWSKGRSLEDWLKTYDTWKAKPETRRMLGLE